MQRPFLDTRPEFDVLGEVACLDGISGQISLRCVVQYVDLVRNRIAERNERPMPVHLVIADAHRRELHTIAKLTATAQRRGRLFEFGPPRMWTIEAKPIVTRPDLRISRHRFAV